MWLKEISLIHYKNFESLSINFDKRINCFFGKNGVGKTNLLDAIYYLSFCKSYNSSTDKQNINHDKDFFTLQGNYSNKNKVYGALSKKKGKTIKLNNISYEKLSEHIGKIPLIMVCPDESNIITEGSDIRRKFMDGIISQYDSEYLSTLLKYKKVLLHRNLCLKNFSFKSYFNLDELELWNYQLIDLGNLLFKKRVNFIDSFTPIFEKFYKKISANKEKISLNYKSDFQKGDFSETLNKSLEKDKKSLFSNVGAHKDEIEFNLKKILIKKIGSQGQQKTYLLALKMAQLELMKNISGTTPILLLDDICDKLDNERINKIIDIISNDFKSQLFITDTDENRVPAMLKLKPVNFKTFKLPF